VLLTECTFPRRHPKANPETRYPLLRRLHDRTDVFAWSKFCTFYETVICRFGKRSNLQDTDAREVCQEVIDCESDSISPTTPDEMTVDSDIPNRLNELESKLRAIRASLGSK